ncbi:MAG: hypothetical protein IME98_01205 [Proteobacteria bacterium]|nr:hypothetical protein [Pseudomonadota bacterium]
MNRDDEKNALRESQRDNEQLRETIKALRDELEGAALEKEHAVLGVTSRALDESTQLKNTIRALREELSSFMIAHAERLEAATVGFTSENEELKRTIKELHGKLKK